MINSEIETIIKRREYFNLYFPQIRGVDFRNDIDFLLHNTCPCCGYYTLTERCSWEVCLICFWEDDGQDESDAGKIYGGPNGEHSLTAYRIDFARNINIYKEQNPNSSLNSAFNDLDTLISKEESDIQKVQGKLDVILDELKSLLSTGQRPW